MASAARSRIRISGRRATRSPIDPDTTSGWNKREYSWDVTAGVTQEIAPRVSVEFNYVRRTWGNLKTTINRALTPADFDTFTYNVPTDSRLPGGGGYPLAFRDVKPGKFGVLDNFQTFTDNIGGSSNNYNGVDFNVNARLRDVTIQGGTSTGNVVEDECGVVSQHPEMYIFAGWGGTLDFFKQFNPSLGQWPQAFCHRESGWQTNFKGLASVHGAEDRRPDQRHLEERPLPRKQLSKRHQPEPRRAGARGADRGNRSWTPALQRKSRSSSSTSSSPGSCTAIA